MAAPARITIELDPPTTTRGRWRARTRVEGDLPAPAAIAMPTLVSTSGDVEPGEPSVVPAAYEPAECTCVEGWCDADHEHE